MFCSPSTPSGCPARQRAGGSHVHTAGASLAGNDASPMSSTLGGVDGGSGKDSPAATGGVGARSGVGSSMEPVSLLVRWRAMGKRARTKGAAPGLIAVEWGR